MPRSTCCRTWTASRWPGWSVNRGVPGSRPITSPRSARAGTGRRWVLEAGRPAWLRAGQWLVGLAIVVFAARSLVRNWEALRSQPLDFEITPGWLVLSAVVVWTMYAILILAWRIM